MSALFLLEQGLEFGRRRVALLASDVANSSTPGFVSRDIAPEPSLSSAGVRFAGILHDLQGNGRTGTLEYAMAALAKNCVWYRALAAQVRSVLREMKTVAEESRR